MRHDQYPGMGWICTIKQTLDHSKVSVIQGSLHFRGWGFEHANWNCVRTGNDIHELTSWLVMLLTIQSQ